MKCRLIVATRYRTRPGYMIRMAISGKLSSCCKITWLNRRHVVRRMPPRLLLWLMRKQLRSLRRVVADRLCLKSQQPARFGCAAGCEARAMHRRKGTGTFLGFAPGAAVGQKQRHV